MDNEKYEDKITILEALTRVHYAPYQWTQCCLNEYFELLRKHKPEWLLTEDLMEMSHEVRDNHQRSIR